MSLPTEEIEILLEFLKQLSIYTDDTYFCQLISKEDFFTKFNITSFIEVCHFLMKALDSKLAEKLSWPVLTPQARETFIKELHVLLNTVKRLYQCHDELCLPQRSHFLAPRCDNPKVMEFLLSFAELTIKKIANYRSDEIAIEELEKEVANVEKKETDCKRRISELEIEIEKEKCTNEQRPKLMETLKQKFVDKGFVDSTGKANLTDLFTVVENWESKLDETIKQT